MRPESPTRFRLRVDALDLPTADVLACQAPDCTCRVLP
jgi:hypothetical protein